MKRLIPALFLIVVLAGCNQASPVSTGSVLPSSQQTPLSASGPAGETGAVTGETTPTAVIASFDAHKYIGQEETVCGRVVDTSYEASRGRATLLNFDNPPPNLTFVVVIWDADRKKFPANPEIYYKGKQVCVTGLIQGYGGRPKVDARDPSQITLH